MFGDTRIGIRLFLYMRRNKIGISKCIESNKCCNQGFQCVFLYHELSYITLTGLCCIHIVFNWQINWGSFYTLHPNLWQPTRIKKTEELIFALKLQKQKRKKRRKKKNSRFLTDMYHSTL